MCLYEVFNTKSKVILSTENCGTINLKEYLRGRYSCPEELNRSTEIKGIFKDLLKAVNYIHLMGVSHRDLKLDNILINNEGRLKVIDFGFAVFRENSKEKVDNFCGTPTYMAPEIIKRNRYDPHKADIWSLGVVLYKLVSDKYPFRGKDNKELYERILNANFRIYDFMSESLRQIFYKIFDPNPSNRATVLDILNSPWFDEEPK